MGVVSPSLLPGKIGNPSEISEKANRPLGILVESQGGEVGVGNVLQPLNHSQDFFAGFLWDAGMVFEGPGDRGVVYPSLLGDIGEGDPFGVLCSHM